MYLKRSIIQIRYKAHWNEKKHPKSMELLAVNSMREYNILYLKSCKCLKKKNVKSYSIPIVSDNIILPKPT